MEALLLVLIQGQLLGMLIDVTTVTATDTAVSHVQDVMAPCQLY